MNSAPRPGAPGDAVERVVLPNGLTVLLRRDASAPVVAIVTYVNAGYFDEPDGVVGVSHVLEHMYFKGTPTRAPGDIARDTKAAGGYLNAGTIYDHTSYFAALPASSFSAGLAVQADAYANSLIDAGELARELEVIIEEESKKRDTPSAVATEECFALLHDVHRIRRWRIGTPDGLRRLSRDDVSRFYRTHYVPSNTVLCVVGDIDPAAALEAIVARYGSLPAGSVTRDRGDEEPSRQGFRWRDLVRDVGQSQFVMGWRTVPPAHADAPALDIGAAVVGAGRASRLYREVRERRLASSVGAFHYTPTELGVFAASAEVPPDRLEAAAQGVWAQIRSLSGRKPGEGELTRVKRGIESRWWRRMESMEDQATYLASWEMMGGWERGAEYLERLLAVTGRDVSDAAARYLTLDKAALVTVRPAASAPLGDSAGAVRAILDVPAAGAETQREAEAADATPPMRARVRADRVEHGVSIFATAGGIPILVRQKPGAPIAHVDVLFTGGAATESAATAGRTTLLARTAVQGTVRRDGAQLAEDIESLGGTLGNGVGAESFGWSVSVPTERLDGALALLAEVIVSPSLTETALETERGIVLAGLSRMRDDMSRQPLRLSLAAAFGDDPYGRPVLGSEDAVRACDANALRAWHDETVRDGHAVIVAVTDQEPEEIAAMVQGALGSLKQNARRMGRAVAWPDAMRESVETRDKAQTAMSLLFPAPARDDASRRAAALLATVASGLGGRFFQTLRDEQSLAYTVSLGARALPRAGWYSSYLACSPGKEREAREGLVRECLRFVAEPVEPGELARAKAYTLGTLALRQQSAAAVLGDIADAWLFGTLDELVSEPAEIAAITREDLHDVARRSFDPARAVWGLVRGTA